MTSLTLFGAGRMGSAILAGWLGKSDILTKVNIIDPHADFSAYDEYSFVNCYRDVADIPDDEKTDILVLAIKPQMFQQLVPGLKGTLTSSSLILSIAAGVTVSSIRSLLSGNEPVVRCMPNIAATLGLSASGLYASDNVSNKSKEILTDLFNVIGQAVWTQNEDDFHAITAVSGSGPAYFFAMCEAMIKAGVQEGLSHEVATNLVIETAAGAGALLKEKKDPQILRAQVTSPNGTTQAGLEQMLDDDKIGQIMSKTINAARRRSEELDF